MVNRFTVSSKTSITFYSNYFPPPQNALIAVIHLGREGMNFLSRKGLGWTNKSLFTDLSIKTHSDLIFIVLLISSSFSYIYVGLCDVPKLRLDSC